MFPSELLRNNSEWEIIFAIVSSAAAGNETLIPIITAQVWFQSITQSSTMWDGFSGEVMKVTYPIVSPIFVKEVNFNAGGSWGNGPLS